MRRDLYATCNSVNMFIKKKLKRCTSLYFVSIAMYRIYRLPVKHYVQHDIKRVMVEKEQISVSQRQNLEVKQYLFQRYNIINQNLSIYSLM